MMQWSPRSRVESVGVYHDSHSGLDSDCSFCLEGLSPRHPMRGVASSRPSLSTSSQMVFSPIPHPLSMLPVLLNSSGTCPSDTCSVGLLLGSPHPNVTSERSVTLFCSLLLPGLWLRAFGWQWNPARTYSILLFSLDLFFKIPSVHDK